jgi:hypothetical protein
VVRYVLFALALPLALASLIFYVASLVCLMAAALIDPTMREAVVEAFPLNES